MMLILSRAGQGIGGAIMFATSLALLGHSFRGRDRGVAFGLWGAITGVAVSLGPILGGVITTGISWRGIFLVNVPIGIAAVIVTRWRVEESRAPHPGRLDLVGFSLLTLGLIGLIYGLIRAEGDQLGRRRGVDLAGARGRAADRLHRRRAAAVRPDVRPEPVPQADLRRRADAPPSR